MVRHLRDSLGKRTAKVLSAVLSAKVSLGAAAAAAAGRLHATIALRDDARCTLVLAFALTPAVQGGVSGGTIASGMQVRHRRLWPHGPAPNRSASSGPRSAAPTPARLPNLPPLVAQIAQELRANPKLAEGGPYALVPPSERSPAMKDQDFWGVRWCEPLHAYLAPFVMQAREGCAGRGQGAQGACALARCRWAGCA